MWRYFGTLANTLTVLAGCGVGLLLKRKGSDDSEKLNHLIESMMFCLGLCTIFASVSGLTGISSGEQAIVVVVSMILGLLTGYFLKIDDRINNFGDGLVQRTNAGSEKVNPAAGFVTACLLFCIGSMTFLGAFESAANPSDHLELSCHTTLIIKSMLDFCSAACLSAGFGISVCFSAVFVFVFQSLLTTLAAFIQPFLNSLNVMPMMNCTGALILISIALNLMGIKKVKTADYLPAIFYPILICWILQCFGIQL